MRADVFLTVNGYAKSRQQAKRLIEDACVTADGRPVTKPSEEIPDGAHEITVEDRLPYVGRGGLKLETALDRFGIDPHGWRALDIGASTGGFTDCLLQRGAESVVAVDSGAGQLDPALRTDPRVTSIERCNARYLTPDMIGGTVRLIVMDVSFISATCILPRFPELLEREADAVCLIKPQFEVGKAMIGKGGIVRDPSAHRFAVERVIGAGRSAGLSAVGLIASPITGGDGNREFLVHFRYGTENYREVTAEEIETCTMK